MKIFSLHRPLLRQTRRKAFTLIELLVAMTVMAIALVLLLQISSGTLLATRIFNQKMDASAQGRAVLDALGGDLANLAMQQGLTVFAYQAPDAAANSQLAFLTQGRGPTTDSRFMSVGYQLGAGGEMKRFTDVVTWSDSDLVAKAVGAMTDFSVVGRGILRFSVVVILDNGQIVPLTDTSANNSWKTLVPGVGSPPFFGMNLSDLNLRRVRGITVGVVAVDEQNYRLLESSGTLANAINAFPAATLPGNTPDDWTTSLSDGTNANLNALPRPVISALQVVQNTFLLK